MSLAVRFSLRAVRWFLPIKPARESLCCILYGRSFAASDDRLAQRADLLGHSLMIVNFMSCTYTISFEINGQILDMLLSLAKIDEPCTCV
eukprot:6210970-Pleurochrysis_carterae.AAC.5